MASSCHDRLFSSCGRDLGCFTVCRIRSDKIKRNEAILRVFRRFWFFYIRRIGWLGLARKLGFCIRGCLGSGVCWQTWFGWRWGCFVIFCGWRLLGQSYQGLAIPFLLRNGNSQSSWILNFWFRIHLLWTLCWKAWRIWPQWKFLDFSLDWVFFMMSFLKCDLLQEGWGWYHLLTSCWPWFGCCFEVMHVKRLWHKRGQDQLSLRCHLCSDCAERFILNYSVFYLAFSYSKLKLGFDLVIHYVSSDHFA